MYKNVNEGRRQEAVFVTGIYTPLKKFFALKGEVLDLIVSIIIPRGKGEPAAGRLSLPPFCSKFFNDSILDRKRCPYN
jgi:hypothetical protein